MSIKKIVLGGGCFWCIEPIFQGMEGVSSVVSGYAGGDDESPSYEKVCSGETGHAEVLEITYDDGVVALADILNVFFVIHDPTTLNKQGNDVGTQYRSIVLYSEKSDYECAEKIIKGLTETGVYENEIVTELVELTVFYPAEDYHQDFYRNNPENIYCHYNVSSKLQKLQLSGIKL